MGGASITQIEKIYYRVKDHMMVDATLADRDTGNKGIKLWDWENKECE